MPLPHLWSDVRIITYYIGLPTFARECLYIFFPTVTIAARHDHADCMFLSLSKEKLYFWPLLWSCLWSDLDVFPFKNPLSLCPVNPKDCLPELSLFRGSISCGRFPESAQVGQRHQPCNENRTSITRLHCRTWCLKTYLVFDNAITMKLCWAIIRLIWKLISAFSFLW